MSTNSDWPYPVAAGQLAAIRIALATVRNVDRSHPLREFGSDAPDPSDETNYQATLLEWLPDDVPASDLPLQSLLDEVPSIKICELVKWLGAMFADWSMLNVLGKIEPRPEELVERMTMLFGAENATWVFILASTSDNSVKLDQSTDTYAFDCFGFGILVARVEEQPLKFVFSGTDNLCWDPEGITGSGIKVIERSEPRFLKLENPGI